MQTIRNAVAGRNGDARNSASEKDAPAIYADVGPRLKGMFDELLAHCLGTSGMKEFVSQCVVSLYLSWTNAGRPEFSISQIAIRDQREPEALLFQRLQDSLTRNADLERQVAELTAKLEQREAQGE